jgi:hypothetical protein
VQVGLGIRGVSHLELVRAIPSACDGGDFDPTEEEYRRWAGLGMYAVRDDDENAADLPTGLYRTTAATEEHLFSASYGGFSHWQGLLSRFALGAELEAVLALPAAFDGRPLVRLVRFSGQGYFGPVAAAETAAELWRRESDAELFARGLGGPEGAEGFLYVYRNFAVAAGLAARQGMLHGF